MTLNWMQVPNRTSPVSHSTSYPPNYVRHSIDTIFFIPDDERTQIDNNVDKAVSKAIDKVSRNPR